MDREVFYSVCVLHEIAFYSKSEIFKKLSLLFMDNKDLLENSTILRGETFDGSGVGQTILEGTLKDVNPQVFVKKHIFGELFEEYDVEFFYQTVLHELVHSFTKYLFSLYDEKNLSSCEKRFLFICKNLHKDYLLKFATGDRYLDSLDEFVAKILTTENWNGSVYYNELFAEFSKFFIENKRNISSLTVSLSNSLK